ncbi:hypothetical protein [Paraburkholderia heleia]|uniref:hypothetical protein n=1 Tax=Paraburkholderia heleia TaxID=634127 RepID=UPI0012EDB178|nr:hypothetical protein [Paraburkholderia heleia]
MMKTVDFHGQQHGLCHDVIDPRVQRIRIRFGKPAMSFPTLSGFMDGQRPTIRAARRRQWLLSGVENFMKHCGRYSGCLPVLETGRSAPASGSSSATGGLPV